MASIYQRARPRRFDEVVGQEHVKDVLLAALRRDQVGHAYLFSGPRGVGKTTSARLLAMAVNCDAAPEQRPCGVCESCRLVQAGQHPDVIELDAASNNSVDDVRDLREKVRLASLRGGRRVWVLDEAHMLSRAAANALLKTLEEPPPGLVFVLATTEPEKLPPTVLSRCQHFRFRRLSEEQIRSKMARLCEEAGVEAEAEALALVARAADGAMRDAESLLERLLVDGERITLAQTEATLGLPPLDRLTALAQALMAGDWSPLLLSATDLYRDGFAPRTVVEQLGRHLRDLLFRQLAEDGPTLWQPQALVRAIDALDGASERFVRQGDLYALEVTLLKAARAGSGSSANEEQASLAKARATTAPPAAATAPSPSTAAPSTKDAAPGRAPSQRAASGDRAAAQRGGMADAGPSSAPAFDPHAPSPPVRGRPPAAKAPDAPTAAPGRFSWHQTWIHAGTQLKAFLQPAAAELEGGVLTLRYSEVYGFHYNQLRQREKDLLALIDERGGAGLEVQLEGPGGRMRYPPRAAAAPTPAGAAAAPVVADDPVIASQPMVASQPVVADQVDDASGTDFENTWSSASEEPPPKKA